MLIKKYKYITIEEAKFNTNGRPTYLIKGREKENWGYPLGEIYFDDNPKRMRYMTNTDNTLLDSTSHRAIADFIDNEIPKEAANEKK